MTLNCSVVLVFFLSLPLVLSSPLPKTSGAHDLFDDLVPGCPDDFTNCKDMGYLCCRICGLCFVDYEDEPPYSDDFVEVTAPPAIVVKTSDSYDFLRGGVGPVEVGGHLHRDGLEPPFAYGSVDQFKPVVYSEIGETELEDGYDFTYPERRQSWIDEEPTNDYGRVQNMLPSEGMQAIQSLVEEYKHMAAANGRTSTDQKEDEETGADLVQFLKSRDDTSISEMVHKLVKNSKST